MKSDAGVVRWIAKDAETLTNPEVKGEAAGVEAAKERRREGRGRERDEKKKKKNGRKIEATTTTSEFLWAWEKRPRESPPPPRSLYIRRISTNEIIKITKLRSRDYDYNYNYDDDNDDDDERSCAPEPRCSISPFVSGTFSSPRTSLQPSFCPRGTSNGSTGINENSRRNGFEIPLENQRRTSFSSLLFRLSPVRRRRRRHRKVSPCPSCCFCREYILIGCSECIMRIHDRHCIMSYPSFSFFFTIPFIWDFSSDLVKIERG